jgi:predicted dehydrogenase
MALSVREADLMIEAAEKSRVTLMVGQSRRFMPALQMSKRYLEKIGKPFNMIYLFMTLFTSQNTPAWWKSNESTGGLVFPMLGSHTLDYSLWLFDDRRPVSVYARGYSRGACFEGDDQASIIITLEDGSFITNHLSINTAPAVHQCVINGPQGVMSFSHVYKKGSPVGRSQTDLFVNGEKVFEENPEEWSFLNQLKEFVSAVSEKRKPSASGEIGRQVVRAIEASMESARTGRVINFQEVL